MGDTTVSSGTEGALRSWLTGDGRPGPIEERIGRRLVRTVDPLSPEGRRLLGSGQVVLIAPGGEVLGPVRLETAWERLREQLEARLGSASDADASALREGLDRLRCLSETFSRN